MINEEYKAMLGGKSVIRELSEYATSRGAEIGYQNVFDYSLGNPSVPAPKSFTDAMVDLYENGDPVAIHGYSPSLGIPSVKDAIAENLNERFGMAYTGNHIFPTTGAAGALSHAMRAVTKPGDEIITFAPYFPEYQPYVKGAGAKLTIGDEDNRDVVLTVAADGAIRNGNGGITVKATLVFENNKDGNRNNGNIVSDVIINEGESRTYTNIYTALEAETGTITLNSGNVYLDKDIEVKSGVTLKVPSDCNLYLLDEVTMTINGTVENEGTIGNVDEIPAAGASPVVDADGFLPTDEDAAAIVVNGAFKDIDSISYTTYYIPGAYYQIVNTDGSWYWVCLLYTSDAADD